MKQETLTRGQVAKDAGIGIETVRFYEQKGLIPKPKRSNAGYRQYDPETIKRVQFITKAKELGFSLSEISELLSLKANTRSKCRKVKQVASYKIQEIEQKIAGLKKMNRVLNKLVKTCQSSQPTTACPILDALDEG